MLSVDPSTLIARLEAALPGAEAPVLAFDADGTLWSGDVGEDFFHHVADEELIPEEAAEATYAMARAHGVPEARTAGRTARAVYAAFEAGRVPEPDAVALVAFCLAGATRDRARAIAETVVARAALQQRAQEELAPIRAWARERRVECFVVSASPAVVVEPSAALLGFDAAHVIAVETHWEGDRMRAEVRTPMPYAEGKVSCLRARIGARSLLGAFGDNAFDVPMLQAARVAVAVRPKARLAARAAEVPGLLRLERR